MRGLVVVAVLAGGCVRPDLIACGDDLQCAQGTVCLADQNVCVDPRGAELPEGTLDFTTIACGASAELTVPLSNHGITPVDFTARSTLEAFSVEPASGTVAPGDNIDLVVTATSAVPSLPGQAIEGALQVETFAGIDERRLSFTPTGGLARVDDTLDFGELPLGTPGQRALVIENAGTAPFGVSFDLHSDVFTVVGGVAAATIAPQSSQMLMVNYAPPTLQTSSTSLALDYDRALCEAPPASVELTGKSSGDPLLASLSKVDFGTAACNEAAEIMNVVITNNVGTEQTLAVNIEQDDEWFDAPKELITIAASGTVTIPVTRVHTPVTAKPGDLESHSASLHISASPAQFTKTVGLTWELRAPLLQLEAPKLDLKQGNSSVTVTNLGTATAPVTVTPPTQSMNGMTVQFLDQIQLGPGQHQKLNGQALSTASATMFDASFAINAVGNCSGPQALEVTAAPVKPAMPATPD